MDTRVELRTAERIRAYHRFVSAADGWDAYPAQLRCGAALVSDDAPVVGRLADAGWSVAARADGYVLLRAPR
jgi:hypothetical protein